MDRQTEQQRSHGRAGCEERGARFVNYNNKKLLEE
jgi:hypothetical protein